METSKQDESYCKEIIESVYMAVNYLPNHKITKSIQSNNTNVPWINFDSTCAQHIEKTKSNLDSSNIKLSHDKYLHGSMEYFVHYNTKEKNVTLGINNCVARTYGKTLDSNPFSYVEVFYQNWFG